MSMCVGVNYVYYNVCECLLVVYSVHSCTYVFMCLCVYNFVRNSYTPNHKIFGLTNERHREGVYNTLTCSWFVSPSHILVTQVIVGSLIAQGMQFMSSEYLVMCLPSTN